MPFKWRPRGRMGQFPAIERGGAPSVACTLDTARSLAPSPVQRSMWPGRLRTTALMLGLAGQIRREVIMPQERARPIQDQTRDVATASAREALEHPHILFR